MRAWTSDFSFSDIVLIRTVCIWFSAPRYLIFPFRDSTWSQSPTHGYFFSETFLQQIFAQGRRISMPLFRNLTAWSDPWNHIQNINRVWGVELLWSYCFLFSGKADIRWCVSILFCFGEETCSTSLFERVCFDVVSTLTFRFILFTILLLLSIDPLAIFW